MIYKYRVYGFVMALTFPCQLLAAEPIESEVDVTVEEGLVGYSLEAPVVEGPNWQAAPGRYLLFGGRRSGRFLVENGKLVTLDRNPEAEDKVICAHLLSSILAALLRQRGLLVLHANVIITPRGAVAISGESGSGKSTSQAALLAKGCSMLADDIAVLHVEENGAVVALPGIPKLHLCEDAALMLGHDVTTLSRYPLRRIKVVVPIASVDMSTAPVPLHTVFLLERHHGSGLKLEQLSGASKFAALQDCIYGPLFPEEHTGVFATVTTLASQIDMIRLRRPAKGWSVNEVVEAILHG